MAFQLSPGVNVSEIDLTTIVPQVGTTTGGFVGIFNWGPVDEIKTMSSEIDLVNTFGLPDANTYESFFTAANFLAYADNLKLVRSVGAAARNAANSVGVLIKNRDAYESSYSSLSSNTTGYLFAAKYPGSLGNSLKVSICANTGGFSTYPYASNYNGAPNTSTYVAGVGGSGDEMHITVVDEDGFISGTANTVLERFGYISKASDATNEDGSSNYYVNVLTDQSKYVYAIAHAANSNSGVTGSGTAFTGGDGGTAGVFGVSLVGGVDASPATANVQVSYDKFKNADETDISLIITGAHSNVVSKYVVDNIAEVRKDCVVFISPAKTDVVNQSGSEVTNITTTRNAHNSSSYAFFDSGWKYQFDKYNNVYRWVPLNGDIAGLCVRTDTQRDAWFSPAGFNRGQIKNVVKLAWNPTKTNRDDLYKIGVNSVVTFQGEGTVLYGDKTMLSKPSAFDRINVRRLFIVLEKAISRAAKYSLFEFNDEFTRAQFKALVEPYLRDVQGRRGIFDFKVVCDSTNNTPEVIDRNEFVGDIYIKPARSINFIQLNFVAVRTGVAFEEIVGRF
jgi:phage tail sheath protein FI